MPICKNCGVEIEEGLSICPLCMYPDQPSVNKKNHNHPKEKNPGYSPLTRREKARLFWELASLFHLSALIVTLLIDFLHNGNLDWSLYVTVSLLASYLLISLSVFAIKKLWLFLPSLLFIIAGLLVSIDYLDGGINWVFSGLPLAASFIVLLGLVLFFSYSTEDKGFNIIAYSALAVGIYCITIEVFLKLGLGQAVTLSWSVIVAVSLLPFVLILLFFHYRLKRGTSLRKFFHL